MYDDFLINFDLGRDKSVRCHHNLDFAISVQGDIVRTTTEEQYILQKIYLWIAIKHGEVPGEPGLGCCIHRYFFKRSTPENYALLKRELEYELKNQIPELNVTGVSVRGYHGTVADHISKISLTISSRTYGLINLDVSKSDLDAMGLSSAFARLG